MSVNAISDKIYHLVGSNASTPAPPAFYPGVVTAIDTTLQTCTVQIFGDVNSVIPEVVWFANNSPIVGDQVNVLKIDGIWWIIGRVNLGDAFQSATAQVTTSESTTSTTYTNLTTVGPTVSNLWMDKNHAYLIIVSASMSTSLGAGHSANMSFTISGASSLSTDDNNAATIQDVTPNVVERSTLWTPTNTGLHTVQAKYKQINPGTATFDNRRLIVKA